MTEAHIVILAAGASSRFSGIKALAPWPDETSGTTLLSHAIATAQTVSTKILVVTGAHHAALLPHLSVPHIHNCMWDHGMGSSIACGILALPATADLAVILPVDQPLVTSAHLRELVECACRSGQAVFTQQSEIIGPPVALPRALFAAACSLSSENGLKHKLKQNQWTVATSATALWDIDTQADMQAGYNATKAAL